jgi:hypothetical protein
MSGVLHHFAMSPRGGIGGDPMRLVCPLEAGGAPIELYSGDISIGGEHDPVGLRAVLEGYLAQILHGSAVDHGSALVRVGWF